MPYLNILQMYLLMPVIIVSVVITDITQTMMHKTESTILPVQKEKMAKFVDKNQLTCMADNIYHEARNESVIGQAAVARVVLNRIWHGGFGSTPCKVVYQSYDIDKPDPNTNDINKVKLCQFSWVCEDIKKPNRNSQSYRNSLQVAYDVLAYDMYKDIVPRNTLFYHNTSIQPNWPHTVVKRIGNHIFYRKSYKNARRSSVKSRQTYVLNEPIPKEVRVGSN
jgi:spore germination cell wall hydrolase CwlJ-like protein